VLGIGESAQPQQGRDNTQRADIPCKSHADQYTPDRARFR
jgi:hypothetical protein